MYKLFRIPCSGCGLTRAIIYFMKGDIYTSIKYNMLGIPLTIGYIICCFWYIRDLSKNQKTLINFFNKNKKIILILAVIIFVLNSIRNVNNELLY